MPTRAVPVLPVLLLPLLVLVPVPVGAQQEAASALVLEDAEGDVRTETQGQTVPGTMSAVYTGADLRSLSIAESKEEVTFTVGVADLKTPDADPEQDGLAFEVLFAHGGREFRLVIERFGPPLLFAFLAARLEFRDAAEQDWSPLWFTDVEVWEDAGEDAVGTSVPRDFLADAQGAAPFLGRALEGVQVRSASFLSDGDVFGGGFAEAEWPVDVRDSMPDDGGEAGAYPFAIGLPQTGSARLSSEEPFRASNGEATTFLYTVRARNVGEGPDTYRLEADVPASSRLQVVLPVPDVALEPGSAVEVPVLVTTPFRHDHGRVETFVLTMTSHADARSVGRLEMGVRYLEVPQPAGHHDALHLHSHYNDRFPQTGVGPALGSDASMSTEEEAPDDDGVRVPPNAIYLDVPGSRYQWHVPLSPALQMGLDFDLARKGRIAVPVGAELPVQDATLKAELFVASCTFCLEEGTLVAEMPATAATPIEAGKIVTFEGELAPTADGDFVPFASGQNLVLRLTLTASSPAPVLVSLAPYMGTGASLDLPLLEYHDPVDQAFAALDGPRLTASPGQLLLANPGEAAVFTVDVENPADAARTLELSLAGLHADWATLSRGAATLEPGETLRVTVAVRVPEGTADGERSDLVLQASSRGEPDVRGLLRLVAEADTEADHEDMAAQAAGEGEDRKSPGPGLEVAMGLALLAFLLRRRR